MTTYADLVTAYLDDPDPETLGPLRRAIRGSVTFTPDLDLDGVDRLLAEGSYAAAVAELQRVMPGAIFSPSAHLRMATALERSGDGSEQHPWSVLRINDEYDMLRALDKVRDHQDLVETGGRRLDRLTCTDGTVAYFDVTSFA